MKIEQLHLVSTNSDEMVQELLAFGTDDDVYILHFVPIWVVEKYKLNNTARVIPLATVLKDKDLDKLQQLACNIADGHEGLLRVT